MNELEKKYFHEFDAAQRAMAASPQSLSYCEKLINESKVTSILDAGSGLSSLFFHSRYENVTSLDDSSVWASKTADLVLKHLNKKIAIEPIDTVLDKKFDFVFYDYGIMEARIFNFRRMFELATRFIYLDDIHVTYYREYIQEKFKDYNIRYKFLPETVDEFGRYGALIIKAS